MTDDINLPPLPRADIRETEGTPDEYWEAWSDDLMQAYARAAVLADRKAHSNSVEIDGIKPDAIPANMLMVLAAFRYCLGRRTYIVGDCARWLIKNADQLDVDMRIMIAREIDEREQRFGLGDTCDQQDWERVKAAMLRAPGAA